MKRFPALTAIAAVVLSLALAGCGGEDEDAAPAQAETDSALREAQPALTVRSTRFGRGRRGEFAFKLGGREIGHLHGDHAAHFMFQKQVWLELSEQGRIVDHPVFPGRVGPAARRIETEADVRDVIELLRLNYDRIVARHGVPQARVGNE